MLDPAFVRMAREAPYLDVAEERRLIPLAQAADERARERLVASHLRLVIQEASRRRGYRVPVADLVQEGLEGMIEALNRFDVTRGVRFNTYAAWWIRAGMNDAAMRDHSIVRRNTTQSDKDLFFKLRTARAALEQSGQYDKAEIEVKLAKGFGVSVDDIVEMTAYLSQGDKSLNAPICLGEADDGTEGVDLLVDGTPGPEELVEGSLQQDQLSVCIWRAMRVLNDREREVICARLYAADSDDAETLVALGARLGCTREWVRQLELRALKKMRRALAAEGIRRNIFET